MSDYKDIRIYTREREISGKSVTVVVWISANGPFVQSVEIDGFPKYLRPVVDGEFATPSEAIEAGFSFAKEHVMR